MGRPLAGLIDTRSRLPAGQLRAELDWLIEIFKREGIISYLEIGARSGDTFWEIVRSMPIGSRAVAVDLPGSTWGYTGSDVALISCIEDLRALGYDVQLILGDSHDPKVADQVKALGPFDAALIDGDHSLAGVTQDWHDHGPLCQVVAFHDLAWKRPPTWNGARIAVPEFWSALKLNYRTDEIQTEPSDCGIGVVWRS